MWPSLLLYAGLSTLVVGLLSMIGRLGALIGVRRRSHSVAVAAAGLAMAALGLAAPSTETRITSPRSRLDEFMPAWQFNEVHSIRVAAPCERAYRAIRAVPADEIHLLRVLTFIRRGGRPGPPSVLNPPPGTPILDIMLKSGFILLAEESGREIVLGTVVVAPPGWRPSERTPEAFQRLRAPGFALAAANFRVEESGPESCTVSTETRIWATDPSSERKFAHYWRVIYPGSALIRRMWLRAIRARAEAGG